MILVNDSYLKLLIIGIKRVRTVKAQRIVRTHQENSQDLFFVDPRLATLRLHKYKLSIRNMKVWSMNQNKRVAVVI